MTAALIGPAVLAVAALLVAVALLITGARGSSRLVGSIGALLVVLGVLGRIARQWVITPYLGQGNDDQVITLLAVEIAAGGVLTAAGLLLLTGAIVIASGLPKL